MARGPAAPSDLIVAIATAPGRGGVGVIRISGKGVQGLLQPLLGRNVEPRTATVCGFRGGDGTVLDQGVALFFPAPRSFTGEDVLELQGHGSPVVMQLLVRRCTELGARIALPGEFSKRAFLNGKLDLAQAEAVADLIDAGTAAAARAALRSLSGQFSQLVDGIAADLTSLRIFVEAHLDFPEEELGESSEDFVRKMLSAIRMRLADVIRRAGSGSVLRNGVHVVLVGQPNVGKSSLLNALSGADRAIVTDIPGTTRDTVRELVEIDGVPIHIVDTAGLRETDDPVEQAGIARAWREVEQADAVMLLVDARLGVHDGETDIVAGLPSGVPRITVHNKADLTGQSGSVEARDDGRHVWISAKNGDGLGQLAAAVLEVAGVGHVGEDSFLGRERHLDALHRAETHLTDAGHLVAQAEFFAEELRLAHGALGEITGECSADDLLGEIFSRFCIGK